MKDRTSSTATALRLDDFVNGVSNSVATIATPRPAPATDSIDATQQIIGFRIMRKTEIAPAWWGEAVEVGETVSLIVANQFCEQQNKVTMNPNRSMRIEFYADPIYVTANSDAEEALRRVQGRPAPIRPPSATATLPSSEFLASINADGDVPSIYETRLATDPEPWSMIEVIVNYVSPIFANDTIVVAADGADGRGRCLVIADGQDLAEAQGWMGRGKVTLAGRRAELFGSVGLDIRRVVAA